MVWSIGLGEKVKLMGWDKDCLLVKVCVWGDGGVGKRERVHKTSDAQCNCSLPGDWCLTSPWAMAAPLAKSPPFY